MTVARQSLDDLDPPCLRNTAAGLTPFTPGFGLYAEGGCGVIDQLPCERLFHHSIKGQIVPSVKSYSPHENISCAGHNGPMRELMTPTEFEDMFVARTKALRELTGMTAKQMSAVLKIPFERYKKYETRTPLPHALVEQFALITRVPVDFVMTGRRTKQGLPEVPGPHMLDEWRAGMRPGRKSA